MEENKTKTKVKEEEKVTVLQVCYCPKQRNYYYTGNVATEQDLKVMTGILAAYFMRIAKENLAMNGMEAMYRLVNYLEEGLRSYGMGLMEDGGVHQTIWPEEPKFDIVKGGDYFEKVDELIKAQSK